MSLYTLYNVSLCVCYVLIDHIYSYYCFLDTGCIWSATYIFHSFVVLFFVFYFCLRFSLVLARFLNPFARFSLILDYFFMSFGISFTFFHCRMRVICQGQDLRCSELVNKSTTLCEGSWLIHVDAGVSTNIRTNASSRLLCWQIRPKTETGDTACIFHVFCKCAISFSV